MENKRLTFSNTGSKAVINREKMFGRFYKESDSSSIGLGLAISKQICIALNLYIHYDFKIDQHIFTIDEKL